MSAHSLKLLNVVPSTLCLGKGNERRLTVCSLAHLKAVERGPIYFTSGTYIARRSLFGCYLKLLWTLGFPDRFIFVVASSYACNVVTAKLLPVGCQKWNPKRNFGLRNSRERMSE
jgi:hypothetical protein